MPVPVGLIVAGVAVAAVGTGIAVAASGSSSSNDDDDVLDIVSLRNLKASKWTTETKGARYADPWDNLRGPTGETYPLHPGREYLRSVADLAAPRVDAMLAKVDRDGGREIRSIDDMVTQSAALAAAGYRDQEKSRKQVNEWIRYLATAAGGVAGAFAAGVWTVVSDFISRWSSNSGSAAKATALIQSSSDDLKRYLEQTNKRLLPFPLHLLSYLPRDSDTGPSVVARMDHLARVARYNAQKLDALPPELQEPLRAWWASLLMEIGQNKQVERVAKAMHGGEWGGLFNLASDEQVLLVAAPIASAKKLPLRDFAIKLWERNGGWSRYPGVLARLYGEGIGGQDEDGAAVYDTPENVPSNATQVQFATLARDAFALAASMTGG